MKNIVILVTVLLLMQQSSAQDFPGYRSGNYSGVNGVFFNPASMAGSPYRFDINLFSFSSLIGNNQASFKLNNLSESFKSDSIKNLLFGKNAGPASGIYGTDIHGPSLMFGIGKNNFAITSRVRSLGTVKDVDGKLFTQFNDHFNNDASLPYTMASNQDMRIALNAWTELGISFARVLAEYGPHSLKGGISIKYLAGAGNGFVNIDKFNTTINSDLLAQDAYLSNTTGRISTGFGGMKVSDFKTASLSKMNSTGIGTDFGFVYEFRPDRLLNKKSNGYKFRIGVSVLDLGNIKYKKDVQRSGSYDVHITGNQRLYLDQLNNVSIDDYNSFFASRPQYFTSAATNTETSYNVSLPTTLQLNGDYHVRKGLYLNLAGQFSLNNKSKAFNNLSYSGITLVPRYEMKHFGIYLPLNYNQLTKMNAGLSLRVGPVFVGSGSVISTLIGQSRQLDVHFGARFGMLK